MAESIQRPPEFIKMFTPICFGEIDCSSDLRRKRIKLMDVPPGGGDEQDQLNEPVNKTCFVCLELVAKKNVSCSNCSRQICRKCYQDSVRNGFAFDRCMACDKIYNLRKIWLLRSFRANMKASAPQNVKKEKINRRKPTTGTFIFCCNEELETDTCPKCNKVFCILCRAQKDSCMHIVALDNMDNMDNKMTQGDGAKKEEKDEKEKLIVNVDEWECVEMLLSDFLK